MATARPLALVAEDTELGRRAIAHALQTAGFEFYALAGLVESALSDGRSVQALRCGR